VNELYRRLHVMPNERKTYVIRMLLLWSGGKLAELCACGSLKGVQTLSKIFEQLGAAKLG
jgi:hypothetical protein